MPSPDLCSHLKAYETVCAPGIRLGTCRCRFVSGTIGGLMDHRRIELIGGLTCHGIFPPSATTVRPKKETDDKANDTSRGADHSILQESMRLGYPISSDARVVSARLSRS